MSEFEEWWKSMAGQVIPMNDSRNFSEVIANTAWQAATAVSDKRIAELTATIESQASEIEESEFVIKQTTTLLAEICLILKGKPPAKTLYGYQDLPKMVLELQAHINVLRENLDYAYYEVNTHFAKNIKDLLASTPAQSLQAHDNEVIERCANVCESLKEQDYCVDVRAGAEAIRALKGK